MADVEFGDILDYLAADLHTRAILLYVEGLTHGRKFMSAARAASRIKPVLVLKAGRSNAGARAARGGCSCGDRCGRRGRTATLRGRNVITAWLGEHSAKAARQRFADARIATYETPDSAVSGFLHRVHYRRNQELLMETPPARTAAFEPDL